MTKKWQYPGQLFHLNNWSKRLLNTMRSNGLCRHYTHLMVMVNLMGLHETTLEKPHVSRALSAFPDFLNCTLTARKIRLQSYGYEVEFFKQKEEL